MLEKVKVSQLLDHNISSTQSLTTFVHVHKSWTVLLRWMNCLLSFMDKIASSGWRKPLSIKSLEFGFSYQCDQLIRENRKKIQFLKNQLNILSEIFYLLFLISNSFCPYFTQAYCITFSLFSTLSQTNVVIAPNFSVHFNFYFRVLIFLLLLYLWMILDWPFLLVAGNT